MGRLAHSRAKDDELEAALCQLAKTLRQRRNRKGRLAGGVMQPAIAVLSPFPLLSLRPELELWHVALDKQVAVNDFMRKLPKSDPPANGEENTRLSECARPSEISRLSPWIFIKTGLA